MERRPKERNPLLLFLGVTGLIVLFAYVNVVAPETLVHIIGFFLLLTVTVWFLGIYVFRHKRHAVLLVTGIAFYLALRYLGLKHPLYAVLLIASIAALELIRREKS